MRNVTLLIILLGLLLPTDAAAQSAIASLEAEQQAIFDTASKSVVFLASKRGFGSGFFVGRELVLTNAHVVGNDKKVSVIVRGGDRKIGTVVARDEDVDLALVHVKGSGTPVHLAPLSSIRVGSWVAAVGHGEGGIWSFTTGMVSNVYVKPGSTPVIQTQIPINQGNSGGPIVTRTGEVVGIVTSKSTRGENLNFAIPVEVALQKFAQMRTDCASCLTIHAPQSAQVFIDGRLVGNGPVVVAVVSKGAHKILAMKGSESIKRTIESPDTTKVILK